MLAKQVIRNKPPNNILSFYIFQFIKMMFQKQYITCRIMEELALTVLIVWLISLTFLVKEP